LRYRDGKVVGRFSKRSLHHLFVKCGHDCLSLRSLIELGASTEAPDECEPTSRFVESRLDRSGLAADDDRNIVLAQIA